MSEKKKKLQAVGRIVLLVVISLVIGSKVYEWNAQTLTGNAMPMPFGWGVSVVMSGSMEPALSVNDLVVIHRVDDYEVNDIVVYQDERSLVIHRIISEEDETVITMGDNNDTEDAPIKRSSIKGKAVLHIPFIGAVARVLKTPIGTILLLVLAVLLFELPYFRQRQKEEADIEAIKEEIRRLKDE